MNENYSDSKIHTNINMHSNLSILSSYNLDCVDEHTQIVNLVSLILVYATVCSLAFQSKEDWYSGKKTKIMRHIRKVICIN